MVIDINSETVSGKVKVEQGDFAAMLSVANAKNDAVHGRVNADIDLGGTLSVPKISARGVLTEGDICGYPLTDVSLDGTLDGRVLTLRRFEGHQGTGVLAAAGIIDLDGEIDARLSAHGIRAGMLSAAAGLNMDAVGTVVLEAEGGGTAADSAR